MFEADQVPGKADRVSAKYILFFSKPFSATFRLGSDGVASQPGEQ